MHSSCFHSVLVKGRPARDGANGAELGHAVEGRPEHQLPQQGLLLVRWGRQGEVQARRRLRRRTSPGLGLYCAPGGGGALAAGLVRWEARGEQSAELVEHLMGPHLRKDGRCDIT